MDISHVILHELIKEQMGEGYLNCRDEELELPPRQPGENIDPVRHLVEEILQLFTQRLGKGLGTFEGNRVNYPFSTLLDEFLQNEHQPNAQASFVEFSTLAMDNLLGRINDQQFAVGGYVLFALYTDNNRKKLCLAMLRNKQSSAINENLEITQAIHVDLAKLHICCILDIDSWKDPNDDSKYMSFIKGRANATTPEYFLKFVGCAEFSDSKVQTDELNQIVIDYCNSKKYDRVAKIEFRRKVYDYCMEKASRSEQVFITDLSIHLDEEHPNEFLEFINRGNYTVGNGFEIHTRSLKKLQRISGGNSDIRVSFEARLFGGQIKLYPDAQRVTTQGQTLVINNTPQNIVNAIRAINPQE